MGIDRPPESPITSREFLRKPVEHDSVLDGLMREAIEIFWHQRQKDYYLRKRRRPFVDEVADRVITRSQMHSGALFDAITPEVTVTPRWVFTNHIDEEDYRSGTPWSVFLDRQIKAMLTFQLRTFTDISKAEAARIDRYSKG